MKKRITALLLTAVLLTALCACGASKSGETVSVQSVAELTGTGSVGVIDRYAGKIVSGQTEKIKKNENKKIAEILVEEGDWVEAGDVLFTYDMQAMQFELDKLQLELEGFQNSIESSNAQISDLESQRSQAASSQQLAYTLQIQGIEADIREAQYNLGVKEREIENMKTSMAETEVTSPIAGRVMSVAELDESGSILSTDGMSDGVFITVMDTATYRVEGNINELNAGSLSEGMTVLIRSRMDETQIWAGTIASIDWENPVKDNNDGMYISYGNDDEMTSTSKYPFYVSLDSMDGLLFGQHVYIEPDYGQNTEKTGLWLPAYFLGDTGESAWLWAATAKDTLEKRSVILGAYDFELDEYEILSGLTGDDWIAFPDETLEAGMAVSRYESAGDMGGDMAGDMGGEMVDGGEGMVSDTYVPAESEVYQEAVPVEGGAEVEAGYAP